MNKNNIIPLFDIQKKSKPFIKWPGGKTQLLSIINELKPQKYNNYIEPFVGGGSVLFKLQPKSAIINDLNSELINNYIQIKENPENLMNLIDELDTNIKEQGEFFYYKTRSLFNQKIAQKEHDLEMSAYFIFLNKHCFNGLYRVNKDGVFNASWNKCFTKSYDEDNILSVSKYLQNIEIYNNDFEYPLTFAKEKDFVFIDSPYDESFTSYTKKQFNKEDHIRLSKLFKNLSNKGCYLMLTNHNTDLINDLYKDFNKKVINVRRAINTDRNGRKGQEIIVTNY